MTTILADRRLGVMVSDSSMTDDDRQWAARKVWRVRGGLLGFAGSEPDFDRFKAWYRGGMAEPADFDFGESQALVLDASGLYFFDANYTTLKRIDGGREAIGTGGKAAICAYEALRFQDPARAVRIACKHDSGSRAPVRVYRLKP
jgi:hypothetical protein